MSVATRLSSSKSTPFIAWIVCRKRSVPEGLDDRSQAIHYLVMHAKTGTVP
jgi:hypothetical protein